MLEISFRSPLLRSGETTYLRSLSSYGIYMRKKAPREGHSFCAVEFRKEFEFLLRRKSDANRRKEWDSLRNVLTQLSSSTLELADECRGDLTESKARPLRLEISSLVSSRLCGSPFSRLFIHNFLLLFPPFLLSLFLCRTTAQRKERSI